MTSSPSVSRHAPEIASRGCLLVWGNRLVEYELAQPDPSRWIAIGVVTGARLFGSEPEPPRMIVGAGKTEEEAVCDLRRRVMDLCPAPAAMESFAVDWAPTGI